MNKQEFDAYVAAGLDLKLWRRKGQSVHIAQSGLALCNPSLKFNSVSEQPPASAPTCALCIQMLMRSERVVTAQTHPLNEAFQLFGTDCVYCNIDLLHPEIVATKDHLIPKSKGGTDSPINLVPACRTCNIAKGDLELTDFIVEDFGRYQEIKHKIKVGAIRYRDQVMAGKIRAKAAVPKVCPPVPGAVLSEQYLEPMDLSFVEFASVCGVSASTVSKVVSGKMKITLAMSVKFGRALGLPPTYWHEAQTSYDLWHLLHAEAENNSFELAS